MDKLFSKIAPSLNTEEDRSGEQSKPIPDPSLTREGNSPFKKAAFTLMEVLIAIGIVGAVAVLTIPNVSWHYKTKVWNTGAEEFSKRLSSAIYEMVQTGHMDGYNSTASFINELGKYLTLKTICDSSHLTDCFTPSFIYNNETFNTASLVNSKKLGQKDYGTEVLGFRTNFGVNGLIAYNKKCDVSSRPQIVGTPCVSYIIDTNGTKAPNKTDNDIRTVGVNLHGCTQVGDYCIAEYATDYGPVDCRESNSSSSDYKYCKPHPSGWQNDYWAGAKKKCDSVGLTLPTFDDLQAFYSDYKNQRDVPSSSRFWSSTEITTSNESGHWYAKTVNGDGEYRINDKGDQNIVLCIE